MKIEVVKVVRAFEARLAENKEIWACGQSPYEAIGALIVNRPEYFGIQCEFAGNLFGNSKEEKPDVS